MKKILLLFFFLLIITTQANCSELGDGIELLNLEKTQKATDFFENYVNNNPNDPDGFYWLGYCYKKNNEEDRANYYLQKSYEMSQIREDITIIDSQILSAQQDYLDMANMYLEGEDYNQAHTYANMALDINPNCAQAYVIKAKIYITGGNEIRAKEMMTKAIQIDEKLFDSEVAKTLALKDIPTPDFEYYDKQGLQYYYNGEIDKAIAFFKKSLDVNFKNPVAQNNLANAYLKKNNIKEARAILKKSKLLNPNFTQTYITLAKVAISETQGKTPSEQKKYKKEAKNHLKKALNISPNEKIIYLLLGNLELEENNFQKAQKYFLNALALDENYYEAQLGIAISHIRQNENQKALMALRKASSMNESSSEISFYLAQMCIVDGKFDEAMEYLKECLSHSREPRYLLELGKIYYYKDDYESAQNAFQEALDFDVRMKYSAQLDNYLGLCYYRKYDIKNALQHLKQAHSTDKNNVAYMYNLALAYKSDQQENMHNKLMQKVFSFEPKTQKDYISLSGIYCDLKKYDVATFLLDSGIKKYPRSKPLYLSKIKIAQATRNTALEQETREKIKNIFK